MEMQEHQQANGIQTDAWEPLDRNPNFVTHLLSQTISNRLGDTCSVKTEIVRQLTRAH